MHDVQLWPERSFEIQHSNSDARSLTMKTNKKYIKVLHLYEHAHIRKSYVLFEIIINFLFLSFYFSKLLLLCIIIVIHIIIFILIDKLLLLLCLLSFLV